MGLTAGAVPGRVDAATKAGLLDLVDHAVRAAGWSRRRACRLLDLDEDRAASWQLRRDQDGDAGLVDQSPGGGAIHGLLDYERDAILELFEALGRGRPLAPQARPPRLPVESGARLSIHGPSRSCRSRARGASRGLAGAGRAEAVAGLAGMETEPDLRLRLHPLPSRETGGVAILDMVSRKWITTVVSSEETSTQVEVCFTRRPRRRGTPRRRRCPQNDQRRPRCPRQPEAIEQAVDDGPVRCCSRSSTTAPR